MNTDSLAYTLLSPDILCRTAAYKETIELWYAVLRSCLWAWRKLAPDLLQSGRYQCTE